MNSLRNPKLLSAFIYDIIVSGLCFWMAYALRFETFNLADIPVKNLSLIFVSTELICIICFIYSGLYQGIWRFSSTYDLVRVIKASALVVCTSVLINFFVHRGGPIPRTFYPIYFVLLIMGLGGGRFIYRFWKDYYNSPKRKESKGDLPSLRRVLIVGAGAAGVKLCREIQTNSLLGLDIVGFVDDDIYKKNCLIHNVKILGPLKEIPYWCEKLDVHKIFLAIPSAHGDLIQDILAICSSTQREIKILPRMDHILDSRSELSLLRNIRIDDLLGRGAVELDMDNILSMVKGKNVMVTGAGGSIGSELCLQLARFKPQSLIFVDSGEFFMYELEKKFRDAYPEVEIRPLILDVRSKEKMEMAFAKYRPDLLFHAAAYKHVPMMELNPGQAIETNVLGTKNVAKLSQKYGVEKFVLISSDKAVNPTNIMGASKRVAEMVCAKEALKSPQGTKFMAVRFGNVLGSSGSVIPLFKSQIENRQDLTVTDPNVIRYFMSIPEACQLVLQAAALGRGSEVFVLDMGEPVKIVDLAKQMIHLAGLEIGKDINIKFTGLRAGEKLFEELFVDMESYEKTAHGKIMKAKTRANPEDFDEALSDLVESSIQNHLEDVAKKLKHLVPEFSHYSLDEEVSIDSSKSNSEVMTSELQ